MKKLLIKIRELLYKIPIDKQLHIGYGELMFPIFLILVMLIPSNLRLWEAGIIAAVVNGLATGLTKEEIDKMAGGKFDFKDFFATFAGSILGCIKTIGIIYIVIKLFKYDL